MIASPPATALVIDDDPAFNRILCRTLKNHGIETYGALDTTNAIELMTRHRPDAVVLDLNLNGASGLALIAPLRARRTDTRLLVLTGYASIATAVEAIKLGADQYLAKPAEAQAILHALGTDAPLTHERPPSEPMSVERLEWEHIQRVLSENGGNISATARALKMHRRTLQRKLSKHPVRA